MLLALGDLEILGLHKSHTGAITWGLKSGGGERLISRSFRILGTRSVFTYIVLSSEHWAPYSNVLFINIFAVKGVIYYVTIALMIFSYVKITCYIHA